MNETDSEKTAIGVLDPEEKTQMSPQVEATAYAANVDCPVCHTPNPPSESYCIDCGFLLAEAPVQVEQAEEPPSAGTLVTSDGTREFALKPGENSVGRENADILLPHNSVSRRHAKITVANGRVVVEDLGSTNGTYVNGKKLGDGESVELTDGCEVVFGSAGLKFKAAQSVIPSTSEESAVAPDAAETAEEAPHTVIPSDSEESAVAPDAAEIAEEAPHIVIPSASEESAFAPEEPAAVEREPSEVGKLASKDGAYTFPIKDGLNTIGRRSEDNDIVIPDPYCSGKHAELLAQGGVFRITDLGSTNGTMVNGVRLEPNEPRVLQPGDEITLGQIAFTIEGT